MTMSNSEEILRLGFLAWAANVAVNALEDYTPIITAGDKGTLTTERKDHTIAIIWEGDDVTVNVRAYTIDNWQTYDVTVKRSSLKRTPTTTLEWDYSVAPLKRIRVQDTGRYVEE